MKFKEAVTYDDMLLVPQYSDITSRREVDISSALKCDIGVTIANYVLPYGYCI
jgi:IMP dehydrogenase